MKRSILIIVILTCLVFSSKETELKKLNEEIKNITEKISLLNKESGSMLNELYKVELNYKKAVSENNRIHHLLSLTNSNIRKKEAEEMRLEKDSLEKVFRELTF